jgi:dihydrofolate reductase
MSLDGVVDSPERWGFPYLNDDLTREISAGIADADAVLLGPKTYRLFAQIWRYRSDDVPMAKFLNHSQKYVVSRTPERLGQPDWGPATLIQGDLKTALRDLKAEEGRTIQVPGSPRLVRWLLGEELLDGLALIICPEIVGSGARLLDDVNRQITLSVTGANVLANGALSVYYRPCPSPAGGATQALHFPDAAIRK